jgi:hypothetical protein
MREALLLGAENASDTTYHSIVAGTATPGRTLELKKTFTTETKPTCSMAITGAPFSGPTVCVGQQLAAQQIPDHLTYTTTVPASGAFAWHVTPSTRPFERKKGQTEAWTLTCKDGSTVLDTKSITIWRNERADLPLNC